MYVGEHESPAKIMQRGVWSIVTFESLSSCISVLSILSWWGILHTNGNTHSLSLAHARSFSFYCNRKRMMHLLTRESALSLSIFPFVSLSYAHTHTTQKRTYACTNVIYICIHVKHVINICICVYVYIYMCICIFMYTYI